MASRQANDTVASERNVFSGKTRLCMKSFSPHRGEHVRTCISGSRSA